MNQECTNYANQLNDMVGNLDDLKVYELKRARKQPKNLLKFPIEVPFEHQSEFSKSTKDPKVNILRKFESLFKFILKQARSKQDLNQYLKNIYESKLLNKSISVQHQQQYDEFVSKLIKIKSMEKSVGKKQLTNFVVEEMIDHIFIR